jgi:hypothetical protein
MRTVTITLAACCLALGGCSHLPWCSCPEPASLPPQQYGGNYPAPYDPLSRPNSYERGYGNSYDTSPRDPYAGSYR